MPEERPRRTPLDLHGLFGVHELFRLSAGKADDPDVAAWFATGPPEMRTIARTWFARMKRCGDDVLELMHDGRPVACVEDAPFGYVDTFRNHANVGFFRGACLDDPARLLEGTGKRMRHVKLRPGQPIDVEALDHLIAAAYADIRACLRD
jgi:hypothetical protein